MAAGELLTMDGRVLWSRQADARRAMASITKIMTAVVVLENADLAARATIDTASASVGESTSYIRPGDTLTVRELLEAMLVVSGNDAAFALASHTSTSVAGFVAMMNAKAAQLGLKGTHFANPHGLDAKDHYTTADDLAALTRYAMKNPTFRTIVAKDTVTLTSKDGTKRTLKSTDLLLDSYPGAEGVKTGWTDKAGHSVVSAARRSAVELVSIVLGTVSDAARFRQARKLLDWGFKHYAPATLATAGTPAGSVPVSDYLDKAVPVMVGVTTSTPVFDLAGPLSRRYETASQVSAPVSKGQLLGVVLVSQGGKTLARVPVVAASAVAAPGPWEAFTIWTTRLWRGVFGGQGMAAPVPAPST